MHPGRRATAPAWLIHAPPVPTVKSKPSAAETSTNTLSERVQSPAPPRLANLSGLTQGLRHCAISSSPPKLQRTAIGMALSHVSFFAAP
eukprot:scaffold59757_cov75-Attheya_sp.AAC.1